MTKTEKTDGVSDTVKNSAKVPAPAPGAEEDGRRLRPRGARAEAGEHHRLLRRLLHAAGPLRDGDLRLQASVNLAHLEKIL